MTSVLGLEAEAWFSACPCMFHCFLFSPGLVFASPGLFFSIKWDLVLKKNKNEKNEHGIESEEPSLISVGVLFIRFDLQSKGLGVKSSTPLVHLTKGHKRKAVLSLHCKKSALFLSGHKSK